VDIKAKSNTSKAATTKTGIKMAKKVPLEADFFLIFLNGSCLTFSMTSSSSDGMATSSLTLASSYSASAWASAETLPTD
jgi:hypothetical protein